VQDIALPSARTLPRSSLVPPQQDIDQVFARYLDPVYRFLYSRLGNREDAEDLTSEVFLKASRQLNTDRGEASIAQWLFTVARTVLADHWRRYYRTGAVLPLDEQQIEDVGPRPASETASPSAERVQKLLGALPDRYRLVLELRFLRGYSIQETAREMGITPENAKVMQHRALAKAVQADEVQE